jgi:hypothetical protein
MRFELKDEIICCLSDQDRARIERLIAAIEKLDAINAKPAERGSAGAHEGGGNRTINRWIAKK